MNFQNLQLEYLSKRDGLSSTDVTSILQDQYGFLWIGTDGGGLNRFDGYSFLHFRHERDNKASLSSDRIVRLFEDSQGQIWVATKNSGLDRYDRSLGIFHNYRRDASNPSSLPHNRVNCICEDHLGNLWFGTDGGLILYSREIDGFVSVESGIDRITALYLDDGGHLWIGGQMGFSILDPDEMKILYGEEVKDYEPVSAILDFGDQSIWIVFPSKTLVYQWSENEQVSLQLEYDWGGLSALADSRGVFWLGGADPGNLYVYGKEGADFTRVTLSTAHLPERSVVQFPINPVLEDREGAIWFTSPLGLYYLSSSDRKYSSHILGERVTGFADTPDGGIWAASHKKIYSYYPDEEILESRLEDLGEHISFLVSDMGYLYMLSSEGLFQFHSKEQSFSLLLTHGYDDIGALNSGPHINLDEDSAGNLWIGTTNGIDFVDSLKLQVLHYSFEGEWPLVLSDSFDRIWAGTRGSGLFRFDENKKEFLLIEDFPHERVWSLTDDDSGVLWIGSDGGLFSYSDDQLNHLYGEEAVLAVESDSDGYIWFSTDNSLYRLDPQLNELSYILSGTEGGITSFLGNSSYLSQRGNLYFGGESGFLRIDPRAFGKIEGNHPVRLSSFSVLGDERRGEKPIFETEELTLTWKDSFFAFEFSAFDFSAREYRKYAYKLEGWDRDWINAGTRHYASYTNLPGGAYLFQVKSSLGGGPWDHENQWALIKINVLTHPLKTWWAVGLYILSGFSLMTLAFLSYRRIQRKKLERQKVITRELSKVNRLKDEFLANTTHELRTPIHGIIGLAESLIREEEHISDSTKRELSLIASSGRRLAILINDILDYSRLKEGDIPLNFSAISLPRLVNTVLMLTKPLTKGKSIELINAVDPAFPLISGDIGRVQQILHNLIGNAVKFAREGAITISAEQEKSLAIIRIADRGVGIPRDKINQIWDQFRQVDGSTSRRAGGSGLGLSITKKLVELQGGTISVESQEGRGSTFSFTLPLSSGQEREEMETEESVSSVMFAEDEEKEPQNSPGARILYVDDDPVNRHIMEKQLNKAYDLTICSGGQQAIESLLAEDHADLLLLDLMMPGMDGFEVCRLVREKYTPVELPVIIITANNQVINLVSSLLAGANDYLSKPYSVSELKARIDNQLNLVRTSLCLLADNQPGEASTLLLIDFAGFTGVDEKSRILSRILPILRSQGGVILRLEGESLYSLFAGGVSKALKAAESVKEITHDKPLSSVIHWGINRERLILEADKLRLAAMERKSSIVLSDAALRTLDDSPCRRLLGYGVLDFEETSPFFQIVSTYSQSDKLFENAVDLYYKEKYDEACVAFNQYSHLHPGDKAAEFYFNSAHSRMKKA